MPSAMSDSPAVAVTIAGRRISPADEPYVIAEVSGNHNGRLDRAVSIVRAAAEAGADAVKLQTYTADTMTIDCDSADFIVEAGPWKGRRLHELYREAATPWEWHAELLAAGCDLGVPVFSTPFDESAVDFLARLDVPAYKIASFELVDHALIAKAASTGKPLIISTGMATHAEIRDAISTATAAGSTQIILLHCVSAYPAPAEEMNLRAIVSLREEFGYPVGLSDHTLNLTTAAAAVALGACVIEKHVTLRRADGGPDSAFSLEPDEFADLVLTARQVWQSLGDGTSTRAPSELPMKAFRRSLYVVQDVPAGHVLSRENVRAIRPGFGLPPRYLERVLGQRAAHHIPRGTALTWDHLA